MCGADLANHYVACRALGSPPRVRSRPVLLHNQPMKGGITSACAEQTSLSLYSPMMSADHLRVCGADVVVSHGSICGRGSPPRVRSRPVADGRVVNGDGITSACAEQTQVLAVLVLRSWDHLRVCGADVFA